MGEKLRQEDADDTEGINGSDSGLYDISKNASYSEKSVIPEYSAPKEGANSELEVIVDPFADAGRPVESPYKRNEDDPTSRKGRRSYYYPEKIRHDTSQLPHQEDSLQVRPRPKSDYYGPHNPFLMLRKHSGQTDEQSSQGIRGASSSGSLRSSQFKDALDQDRELSVSTVDKDEQDSNSKQGASPAENSELQSHVKIDGALVCSKDEISSQPSSYHDLPVVSDSRNSSELRSPPPPPPPPPLPKDPMLHQQMPLRGPPRLGGSLMPSPSAFLKELTDPSRRKPLRKLNVPPKPPPRDENRQPIASNIKPAKSSEPKMSKEEMENMRSELLIQLLGFMEAPAGDLEELMEKCKESTMMVRSLLYTLVRRGWVRAFRVLDKLQKKKTKIKDSHDKTPDKTQCSQDSPDPDPAPSKYKHKSKLKDKQKVKDKTKVISPVSIWPGKEWSDVITLEDISPEKSRKLEKKEGLIDKIHMYRFDIISKKHTLDVIILIKGASFPDEVPAFDVPPPPKPTTLEEMNAYEQWESKRLKYEQCDWAQYNMIHRKLLSFDTQTQTKFQTLTDTVGEIGTIGEKLRNLFKKVPIEDMKLIVERIPDRIKEVKNQVQNESGIIIRADDLKLTPEFLSKCGTNLSPGKVFGELGDEKRISPDVQDIL